MDLKLLLLSFVFFIGSSGEAENSGLLQELQTAYSEVLSRLNQAEANINTLEEEVRQCKGLTLEERVEHLEDLSKIKTLRSCYELAQYGINTSGLYQIDPDGDLIGVHPIEVYCDFESGQTVFVHDSENLVVADHCDQVGCFKHEIHYKNVMSQIVALTQISEHCEQEIDFGCFSAPLASDLGDQFGWWTDRNGDPQYFFTGNHIGEHVCTCGLDDSCFSPDGIDRKCNCDSKSPEWFNDAGIITAKDILPIMSVAYGPLVFDTEVANFTIGPLKCSGKRAEDSTAISCNSLKRSGVFQSSAQILKYGYYPRLSFCDMNAVNGYDGNMETLITYAKVDSLPGGVYFAGIRDNRVDIHANEILTFIKTPINIGNGFNAETGHFVAPVSGQYQFSISARAVDQVRVDYFVDEKKVQQFHTGNGDNSDVSHIFHLVLEKGQTLYLKVYTHAGYLLVDAGSQLVFIGELVSETV